MTFTSWQYVITYNHSSMCFYIHIGLEYAYTHTHTHPYIPIKIFNVKSASLIKKKRDISDS